MARTDAGLPGAVLAQIMKVMTFLMLLTLLLRALPAAANGSLSPADMASSPEAYGVEDLIELARRDGLGLKAARAQVDAASAAVITAVTRPNPELDWSAGPSRARPGGTGTGASLSLTQRIESTALRSTRLDVARLGEQGAQLQVQVVENNLSALIKARYFEVLKREEELIAAQEELQLTEQIRERVNVRFRSGEGARFDLLRAEAEVALADKEVARIRSRLTEARTLLRQAVGATLPDNFRLRNTDSRLLSEQDFPALMARALGNNPEVQRSTLDIARADKRVQFEQASVMPGLALRMSHDRETDVSSTRLGVTLSLPLLDKRSGPIAEARAQAARSRHEGELLRFDIEQTLNAAWQQYQASLRAVETIETGLLQRSRQVVTIAEAAYRLGERGILEYLDARRQFRALRADLIQARFELQLAVTELERLAAAPLRKTP